MELSCKAKIDDSHGRTRLEWAYSSEEPSTRVAVPVTGSRELDTAPKTKQTKGSPGIPNTGSGTQSEYYDLSALDELPPVRAVRVMLRSAAEVEHQLFLQYLYAASSLRDPLAAGIVADIAVEEMGHLLTVNNLLIALDGDPYFGRGPDNPTTPTSDPFAFKLRAASQSTLAMFTAAESPSPTTLNSWFARVELARILNIADTPLGRHPVQRVGALYQRIVELLTSESSLDEAFASATLYFSIQASHREAWSHAGVSRRMIVEPISNRKEAIIALNKIMTQGEGFFNDDQSHFTRFRRAYRGMLLPRAFPSVFHALLTTDRSNPALRGLWRALGLYSPDFDALEPGGKLASALPPTLQALTNLLNTRYQLLLVRLYEIFAPNGVTARNIRIDSALREMRFVLSPLMDCIRQNVAAGGTCPSLYVLPPYFDPHNRDEQITLRVDLLNQSSTFLGELRGLIPTSGTQEGVATAINEIEIALTHLPRSDS
jgi:Ferritin-like